MFRKIVKMCVYALVFLVPLFWLPFSLEAFDFNKVYLLFFLTSLGIIAWIGEMIFEEKRLKFKRMPLDLFVLGFALVTILSTVFSVDKISSLLGSYGRFWPSLLGILSLCGFYFLLSNYISFSESKKEEGKLINGIKLLKVFLISSSIVVAVAYLSIFGLFAKLGRVFAGFPLAMKFQGFNTIAGSLEGLAMFIAFIIVFVVVLVAFRGKIPGMFISAKGKLGYYIFLFASLFLLIIIDFKVAWLSIALSLLVFLVISFWKRIFKKEVHRLDLPIVFLIIALIFIFTNPLKGLMNQIGVLEDLPYELLPSQHLSWTVGAQGVKDNLIIGSGPSTFDYLFNKFKPQTFLENPGTLWRLRLDRAGSHIAETLGTAGILGTLFYLVLLGVFFLLFYFFLANLKTKDKDNNEKEMVSGIKLIAIPLLAGVLCLFLAQIFYYQNTTLAFSFWLVLGLGILSLNPESKKKEFSFSDFPEIGLVLSICFWVILIGFVFIYFGLGKYYLADTYYRDYLEKPTINTEKLEQAARLASQRSTYHIVLARDYLSRFNEEMAKEAPEPQVVANMAALALQEAKRAAEMSPNRIAAQETLSVVYRDIQGVAQGALEWSLKSFEDAVRLEPKNPALLTEFGKLVASSNDIERAKQLFQEAINMKGDYLDAHLQLALLTEAEDKPEEAQAILENAVLLNPQSVEAHFQLGRVYYNNDENERAKVEFTAALSIFPNHSNSLYSLALIEERLGNQDEADQLFEKVLELNPGNADVIEKLKGYTAPVVSEPEESEEEEEEPEEEGSEEE